MNLHSKIGFLAVLGLVISFSACKPDECDQEVPELEFKSLARTQDSLLLTVTFKDCDGDIGLTQSDTAAPYDFNFFIYYNELINGEWVERNFLDPELPLHTRVPELEPKGGSKTLEGDIEVTLLNFKKGLADTIRYEMVLRDRALNESNRVVSSTIVAP